MTVKYMAVDGDGRPVPLMMSGKPVGSTFDDEAGVFSWTPAPAPAPFNIRLATEMLHWW